MLCRIAQEALHNAAKHARANQVDLWLECTTEEIVLEIADDGASFDPTESFVGRLGLRSMRERALRLGGMFNIESALGKGCRIRVKVPLRADP